MGKTKTSFVSDTVNAKNDKKKSEKKGKDGVKVMEAALPTETIAANDAQVSKKQRGPRVRGKKYLEAKKRIDRARLYSPKDAVALAKDTSVCKFDGSVELHLVVRKEDLATTVELPHSTGKTKKVEVADEKTIEKLTAGKVDFDILLATADMMPKLVPFARILGPRGMMPNPKNGTVIKSAKDAEKFNAAKLTIKTEKKTPLIHTTIGKISMKDEELVANLEAILNAVTTRQILKAYVVATMGPSVKVAVA